MRVINLIIFFMIFINKNSLQLKKFQYKKKKKKKLCICPNVKEICYTSFSQLSFNFLFLQI